MVKILTTEQGARQIHKMARNQIIRGEEVMATSMNRVAEKVCEVIGHKIVVEVPTSMVHSKISCIQCGMTLEEIREKQFVLSSGELTK
jgi:protein-arginine kinase activator protein McsA